MKKEKGTFADAVRIFTEMAKIWEILGEEFKVYAYLRAINLLKLGLKSGPGIGKKLDAKINEILRTGTLVEYEELRKLPEIKSIEILHRIKGFGPEFIKKNKLTSVNDIKEKVKSGKLSLNHQQEVGLRYYNDLIQPIPRAEIAKTFRAIEKLAPQDVMLCLVGSYRRGKKTSKDVDILFVKKKMDKHSLPDFIDLLINAGIVKDHFVSGGTRFSGVIKVPGVNKIYRQMDILFVPKENLAAAMMHSTGSNNFNRRIRLIAKIKGMKLSEKGLYKGKKKLTVTSERQIFEALGVPYLKPEERIV